MKKLILFIVMATLCLFFKADGQNKKAFDVTGKGIQIGEKVPDVIINNIHNYKTTTAKLSDFKGKLVILDFWATWCSPCVAMMPKMEILKEKFEDKIEFLSISYQIEKEVMHFLDKIQKGKSSNLLQITGDKELHKLFPHIYLPHYIWIDRNGTVKAITGLEEITEHNIEKMLNTVVTDHALNQKKDMKIPFDESKLLLINGNGGDGSNIVNYSIMTGYTEGLPMRVSGYKNYPNISRMTMTNVTIPWFYRIAYANGTAKFYNKNTMKINIKDSTKLVGPKSPTEFQKWLKEGNTFCFDLAIPKVSEKEFFKVMRAEISKLFPYYQASIKKVKQKCIVLIRTTKLDKVKTKDSLQTPELNIGLDGVHMVNVPLYKLVLYIQTFYRKNTTVPVLDQTGYNGNVDLVLNSNITDLNALNNELIKYDLQFAEKEVETDVLYIEDASSASKQETTN